MSGAQDGAARSAEVAKLIVVLQSDAAPFDKAKACQRLALIGTKEAVPALAALLADERLSSYARFGLEPIPDPSVDDALRDALGKLHGRLLAGVINSIGVRRDVKAVGALTKLASDPASEVAPMALAALGQIATFEATETLQRALASGSAAVRGAAADACLVSVERLLAQDKREESVRLCDAVRGADVPQQFRVAATRGAILARQSAGLPLLLEQLKVDDNDMFRVALRTSRELPGDDVTRSLIAELDNLPPARQVLLICAIGDRQDAAALPAMRKRAASGPKEIRLAAIHVLGQMEDVSAVTVLLETAVSGEAVLAEAAHASLMKLHGSAVDTAIVTNLDHGDPKARALLLDLVAQHAIASALPAVLKAADDPNEQVRLAAIKTLGRIIGLKDFAILTNRLLAAKSPQETAAVQETLKVACLRMPDRDTCASRLLDCLPNAPIASKCFLIELLGSVGGARALKGVSAAAEDANEDLQDAATRVLGTWMSVDAAPKLLDLAKTLRNDKFRIRALRGYIRIVRQMSLPMEQKLAMCEAAFGAAQRDEERRLVLAAFSRIPSAKAISMVIPHLANPALAEEAAAAALAIGEKIVQTDPRVVANAMQQVLKSGVNSEKAAQAKALLERTSHLVPR
ncbi:MAG: HEAT repeat domain-containing protein [Planctomycetota bacterium]